MYIENNGWGAEYGEIQTRERHAAFCSLAPRPLLRSLATAHGKSGYEQTPACLAYVVYILHCRVLSDLARVRLTNFLKLPTYINTGGHLRGVTLAWRHSLGGYARPKENFMCYFCLAPGGFSQLVQSGPSLEETAVHILSERN
jgi:hypothetical protein